MNRLPLIDILTKMSVCQSERERLVARLGPMPMVTLQRIRFSLDYGGLHYGFRFWSTAFNDRDFENWLWKKFNEFMWDKKSRFAPILSIKLRRHEVLAVLACSILAYHEEWSKP